MINVKFDLYFKKKLGTLFKSNEVDLDGVEANVNLDLNQVASMKINYLVNGNVLTDDVIIKDVDKKLILIPFKSEVRIAGAIIEFEIQADMLNGDVKVSQTYVYDVEVGIGEGVSVGTGGSTDGHSHSNLSTLNKITEAKFTEWNNKSTFDGDYNSLSNKPTIPNISGLATIDFVKQEIEEIELTPGPQGEKGERGEQGPQGEKGEPGDGGNAESVNGISIAVLTQTEYDELSTKSETTLYIIKG